MKLYSAPTPAPNPRRVHIFLAEKGIDLPRVDLSIVKEEQKVADFVAKNSRGQVPVLEIDGGRTISESISICRYLEELHPEPALFGTNAFERASIDMWVRRIEFNVLQPVGQFWAHAHPFTARVVTQFKDYGESNRARWDSAVHWLDGELSGASYICGDAFTMADIAAFTTIEFAQWIGLPVPDTCHHLQAWYGQLQARPSIANTP